MDSALLAATELMSQSFSWALLGCFIWGLISIALSPCHLASIPLLMAYVSGQRRLPSWQSAAGYAVLFGSGLFLCIATIGFICAEFGRLMGDVPATVTMLVGLVISVFGLEMMGAVRLNVCIDFPNIRIKGAWGAFVLGCAYGVFSGACTFGFLAPGSRLRGTSASFAARLVFGSDLCPWSLSADYACRQLCGRHLPDT